MLPEWVLLIVSISYLMLLFGIAYYGDRTVAYWRSGARAPVIYALSLAIYCTSWTFFGSVGRATVQGGDFLFVYFGPILVITAGYPLMRKVLAVAQAQNVTSVADFIGARYGKSRPVAALATVIAAMSALPYIALQLQAVSQSFETLAEVSEIYRAAAIPPGYDTALYVALLMGVFSILFGVRHLQASERHDGLILAIAFESLVKLAAFLAAGLFVVWGLFSGPGELIELAAESPEVRKSLDRGGPQPAWLAILVLSSTAFLCLPRQFHVAIVSGGTQRDLRTATWLFPLYLVAINLFVPAIAAAGLILGAGAAADQYVLILPMMADQSWLSLFIFIGGLSAATSMVIVAAVALSTMICNELVVPALLGDLTRGPASEGVLGERILLIRRVAVIVIMALAYLYYLIVGGRYPLASIGLVSFCAAAQLAPALIIGLYWRGAHRLGVFAGMMAGLFIWAYTMLLPTFFEAEWLVLPYSGLDRLTQGTFLSLGANVLLLIAVSLAARGRVRSRDIVQAEIFVAGAPLPESLAVPRLDPGRAHRDLVDLAARFIGAEAAERAFAALPPGLAEAELADFTERLLSGAIGAASARVVVSAARDTEKGRAERSPAMLDAASQAILFSRDLLRATLDNVTLGIAVFDADRRLAMWNRRFVDLFGLPGDLARIGTSLETAIAVAADPEAGPGLDLAALLRDHAEGAAGSARRAYERRRKDGVVLDIQTAPMPGGGFVLVATDVTERVHSAERLRESEHMIRVYTDNVPVLMAYVDREERYRFTNRPYQETLGLALGEVRGIALREALGEERYLRLKARIDAAFAGQRQEFEVEFAAEGPFAIARGLYLPHFDEAGGVVGFFTLYQDVTEQRRAQRALIEVNEQLERRVADRTADLRRLNEQLEAARSAADEANLGKTRFLAAASHDLLQPLHAARLFAASLAERVREGREGGLVGQIDQALGVVEELLRALLDISRLDSGALKPDVRPIAIGDLLRSVAVAFEPQAERRGLAFRVVPSGATVLTDPTLVRRILQNFLSNALRYTRKGGVLIGCRRRGGHLVVEVWDTGPGIPEDKLTSVFEEFRRLDDTEESVDEMPGLGLGLAIVERIGRMLGHDIGVRSRLGRGSVFSVSLPLTAKPAAALPVRPSIAAAADRLAGLRILCVDNDRQILAGVKALLEEWGCRISVAADLDRTLAVVAADGPPDVVLIDHHLGEGQTGFAVLDRLTEVGVKAPAILITADHGDALRDAARARGVPLLNKPVKPAVLRSLMSQLLATSRRAAAE